SARTSFAMDELVQLKSMPLVQLETVPFMTVTAFGNSRQFAEIPLPLPFRRQWPRRSRVTSSAEMMIPAPPAASISRPRAYAPGTLIVYGTDSMRVTRLAAGATVGTAFPDAERGAIDTAMLRKTTVSMRVNFIIGPQGTTVHGKYMPASPRCRAP